MPSNMGQVLPQESQQPQKTIVDRVTDALTKMDEKVHSWHEQQPSLESEARSWLREGAKDLWNAVVPAFPDSQRMVDEQGTPLNPTPQVVTAEMGLGIQDYAHRAQFQQQDTERVH